MIFQQELNAQRFFSPALINASTMYGSKTTAMTREERILRRRQEKRRRQIQEVKAGCKRFMAMLFSHIGLSGLVVAYTIIGALLFGKIEQGFEKDVKYRARIYRENSTLSLIRFIFENFYDAVGKSQLDCNQTADLIHVVLWYIDKAQNELQPPSDIGLDAPTEFSNDSTLTNTTMDTWFNQTSYSLENMTTTTPLPLITTTSLKIIDVNHQIWVKKLQHDVNDKLVEFIKKIIEFIDDDGWNGNDSLEDMKWSYAGAVLYAITVITTIGYGHATPKTDPGKFLTILYALVGIPLVFLYLSNIGDYLADVFRALYSRTCRTTCERFCSFSLLTSIFRSLTRRDRKISDTLEPEEQLPRMNMATSHAHYKRKKRVLLKKICRVDPFTESNVVEETDHSAPEGTQQNSLTNNQEKDVRNGKETKLDSESSHFHAFYRRIRKLLTPNSTKLEEMVKRTKTGLTEMLIPVTRWIRQVSNGFLYNTETAEPPKLSEQTVPTAGVVQNFCSLDPNSLPILLQSSPGTGTMDQITPIPLIPGTTRALVEDPLAQPSLLVNSLPATFGNHPILPAQVGLGMSSTFGSTLRSQTGLSPISGTMTLPPVIGLQSEQSNVPKPRYFTFDGQHRKFYLSARYLRSAERQRRHKRRVAKRLKEQARAEMNQLQNAISYGFARDTRKRNTMDEKPPIATSDSAPDKTLDILSITSEVVNENGIPLLCWKDIDLDLEVRSIDDEVELARLTRKASNDLAKQTSGTRETPSLSPQLASTHFPGRIHELPTRMQASKTAEQESSFSANTHDIISVEACTETRKRNAVPNLKRMWPTTKHNKISAIKEPTVLENRLISSDVTDVLEEKIPIALQSLRPIPANKQRVGTALSPSKTSTVAAQRSQKLTTPDHLETTVFRQYVSQQAPYLQKVTTLPPFAQDVFQIPAIKGSASFQHDHIQSLLHSTVISNPAVQESVDSELDDRTLVADKSRLSLASSRGDLNSDVQIQLSYYSQQESVKTEEELSFFSFRDRVSTKEDLSKVTVPISLSLLIMTTYIVIGAVVFSKWENESFLKWSYFCFITLSSIGFGDIVPGTKIDSQNTKEKMIIISLYVAIGLSVFAMCFKLMQEEVVDKVKWFAIKVGILKSNAAKDKTEKSL